jgi:hypothetical protein
MQTESKVFNQSMRAAGVAILLAMAMPCVTAYSAPITLYPEAMQSGSVHRAILGGETYNPDTNLNLKAYSSQSINTSISRRRFAMDYNLSSLPIGSPIQQATLSVNETISGGNGQGTILLYESLGSGPIGDANFLTAELLQFGSWPRETHSGLVTYDLTAAVQHAVDEGWQHLVLTVGFGGGYWITWPLPQSFQPTYLSWSAPSLTVLVPEPSGLFLGSFSLLMLLSLRLAGRKRRNWNGATNL